LGGGNVEDEADREADRSGAELGRLLPSDEAADEERTSALPGRWRCVALAESSVTPCTFAKEHSSIVIVISSSFETLKVQRMHSVMHAATRRAST